MGLASTTTTPFFCSTSSRLSFGRPTDLPFQFLSSFHSSSSSVRSSSFYVLSSLAINLFIFAETVQNSEFVSFYYELITLDF